MAVDNGKIHGTLLFMTWHFALFIFHHVGFYIGTSGQLTLPLLGERRLLQRRRIDIGFLFSLSWVSTDRTQLLLCRAPSSGAENAARKAEPRECVHSGALVFTENRKDELPGKFTVVRRAFLHRDRGQYLEVAVKALKPHLEDSHLKVGAGANASGIPLFFVTPFRTFSLSLS